MQHPCFFCGGAAHPATGHAYSETVLACWRCTLEAWSWVRAHTNGKGRRKGPAFYEHVGGPQKPATPRPESH